MFVALTFGGGSRRYNDAAERFKMQLEELEVFDKVISLGEKDLKSDNEFWKVHGNFIENNKRGYGYWIWKPYLIMQQLSCMKDEDVLFYADAGCEVDLSKKEKFIQLKKYFLEKSCNNILARKQDGYKEEQYCKMDTFVALDCNCGSIRKTPQYQATFLAFKNTKEVRDFVNQWYKGCFLENYHLLDDTPSKLHNAHRFKEHRHDQSLFSILYKKTFPFLNNEFNLYDCVFVLRTRNGGSNLHKIYRNMSS